MSLFRCRVEERDEGSNEFRLDENDPLGLVDRNVRRAEHVAQVDQPTDLKGFASWSYEVIQTVGPDLAKFPYFDEMLRSLAIFGDWSY